MLIFIDESGDAGFKLEKGSSEVFVVVLVIFDDELDAEDLALKIKRFRRETLKKGEDYEFKFVKTNTVYRRRFFELVSTGKFRVRAVVFRKRMIYSNKLRKDTSSFYSYAIKELLKNNSGTVRDAKVRLDASGERKFRKSLAVYLRKELNINSTVVQNLKFRDSRKDVLIQLADMVAGAIRRSYDETKTDSKLYTQIIQTCLEDIWEFK